jgi:ParB family chromosome partitioning protein
MNKEKKALGKGLSALISQPNVLDLENNISSNLSQQVLQVDISNILPNPNQPRKIFSEEEIADLSNSIKEHGVLQPILLKKISNGYEIIAGERRWHASTKAGLTKIPAIVMEASELQSFEFAIIENIQRQDLNPLEEAFAYQKLIQNHQYTHEQLAKKLSKSRSYISNALRLLSLPENVKNLIEESKLSFGHARAIINADNPEQLANKIIDQQLSVRETEQIVKGNSPFKKISTHKIKISNENNAVKNHNDDDLIAIEKMLTESLNMPVQIKETAFGGQLQIDFKTLQELDTLIQMLGSKGLNF